MGFSRQLLVAVLQYLHSGGEQEIEYPYGGTYTARTLYNTAISIDPSRPLDYENTLMGFLSHGARGVTAKRLYREVRRGRYVLRKEGAALLKAAAVKTPVATTGTVAEILASPEVSSTATQTTLRIPERLWNGTTSESQTPRRGTMMAPAAPLRFPSGSLRAAAVEAPVAVEALLRSGSFLNEQPDSLVTISRRAIPGTVRGLLYEAPDCQIVIEAVPGDPTGETWQRRVVVSPEGQKRVREALSEAADYAKAYAVYQQRMEELYQTGSTEMWNLYESITGSARPTENVLDLPGSALRVETTTPGFVDVTWENSVLDGLYTTWV